MFEFTKSLPMTNGLLNFLMLFGLLAGISLFFNTSINTAMYGIVIIMMFVALSGYLFLIVQTPKGTKRNDYIKKLIFVVSMIIIISALAYQFNGFCSDNHNSIACGGF